MTGLELHASLDAAWDRINALENLVEGSGSRRAGEAACGAVLEVSKPDHVTAGEAARLFACMPADARVVFRAYSSDDPDGEVIETPVRRLIVSDDRKSVAAWVATPMQFVEVEEDPEPNVHGYLESGGTGCPWCGADATVNTHDEWNTEQGTLWTRRQCLTCSRNWFDNYNLHSIHHDGVTLEPPPQSHEAVDALAGIIAMAQDDIHRMETEGDEGLDVGPWRDAVDEAERVIAKYSIAENLDGRFRRIKDSVNTKDWANADAKIRAAVEDCIVIDEQKGGA